MKQTIIKVQFLKPVDGKTEYFFGSIAAIYERFTPVEIGCSMQTLWGRVTLSTTYANSKCIITRHPIERKPQTHKS